MSLIGLGMNLILAGLLVAALVMGVRLNRRLAALRDSHDGFATAVRDLNIAAQRAEQGLADLRAATDEATDVLSDRIEKARALAVKLERLVKDAPSAISAAIPAVRAEPAEARPVPRPVRAAAEELPPLRDDTAERRLGELLAAAREARTRPERLVRREAPPSRSAVALDDDLFEPAARGAGAGR